MTRIPIFRVTAVLLLLLTGAGAFACEVLAHSQCDRLGMPGGGPQSQSTGDDCICCCARILIADTAPAPVVLVAIGLSEFEDTPAAVQKSSSIYHPPRG